MEHVDPSNLVYERLYRDDMSMMNKKMVKDITSFNKDMSRVLVLDSRTGHVNPEDNHLKLKPYTAHNPNDAELKRLIEFFKDNISEQVHNVNLRELSREFRA